LGTLYAVNEKYVQIDYNIVIQTKNVILPPIHVLNVGKKMSFVEKTAAGKVMFV
jgi:hypothetical protein